MTWSAAILCGGRSRRMGRDKALLEVDGVPMVVRVAQAADAAGASGIATVGGDGDGIAAAFGAIDVDVVADDTPGEGPLGGILTALSRLDTDLVLILGCDLVTPSPAAMAATVAALADQVDAVVAVPWVGDRAQWMHSAWRKPSALAPLAAAFGAGERAVHAAVAVAGLAVFRVEGLAARALADADTPADL
jgi:molybdopterin-guanine dinucleotide biosynthesis protein A